jgi:Type IV secretion-system coupling protein DNA-binding domain
MEFYSVIAIVLVIVAIIGLFGYLLFVLFLDSRRRAVQEDFTEEQVYFSVRVPRDNEYEIGNAEQMFAGLYSLFEKKRFSRLFKEQIAVSFEIVALKDKIKFYVVCPKKVAELVERQILGAYPSAEVIAGEDYNIYPENSFIEYSELRLDKDSHLPIVLHDKLGSDPLNLITGTLSKVNEGEALAIQYLISPADDKWRKVGRTTLNSIEKAQKDPENKSPSKLPQEVIQGIGDKISKIGFETTIRIISVAKSKEVAKLNLTNTQATFQQFNNPEANRFSKLKVGRIEGYLRDRSIVSDFINRIPPIWSEDSVLNTAELATIFHYPSKKVETPHIEWLMAKNAPADETVGSTGLWLGTSAFRGQEKDIAMGSIDDRRRHMYIIGQTGTGKSYFMQNLALQDINAGHGVCYIDPHGDGLDWLLERIPAHRAEDVIYWDPGDTEKPFGFNVLDNRDEKEKHFVANSFYKMIQKLFDPNNQGITGPLLERAMRSVLLTSMAKKGGTLIESMKCLLLDWDVINDLKQYTSDPFVKDYWEKEIPATPENRRGELMGYFTSKLDRFISNQLMRNMLGQAQSSFDLRSVMDNKKILFVNLSKGKIGAENSEFLGLILIPRILSAAMSRADTPLEQRVDFFLYVDEFQNFATDDFEDILSEARKYRLNLVVANQYIGQIKEEIKQAIIGNVGTKVTFRVGLDDAEYLEKEYAPVFNKNDLTNIENQNAYVKLMVNGKPSPPFSMRTTFKKFPKGDPAMRDLIIQISRNVYGRDKALVEEEIIRRMNPKKTGATGPTTGTPNPLNAPSNLNF